jgi:hypothetical protein
MRMKSLLLACSLLLFGCGGTTGTAPPATADESPAVLESATAAAPAEPQGAQRPAQDLLTKDGVNYACQTDQDCAVKDIGNCCGYYPACVNAESPTFPDKVKAQCASEGQMAVCGYPEIASCSCIEGRCAAITGITSGASVQ